MYRQTKEPNVVNKAICPECTSTMMKYIRGEIICNNCGHLLYKKERRNKYNSSRTTYKDYKYDSQFEATTAAELDMLKMSGDIKDWERQYKVICVAYLQDGSKAFEVSHKVDFRIHHLDGSYELHECKGVETDDYKWRRKCLENLWLPLNKDHIYTVKKQNSYRKSKKKSYKG